MKIKPMNGYVAIVQKEIEKKTEGGILLPGSSDPQSHIGIVLAVQESAFVKLGVEMPSGIEVKVDDMIMYNPADTYMAKIDGRQVRMIPHKKIMAVIDNDGKVTH